MSRTKRPTSAMRTEASLLLSAIVESSSDAILSKTLDGVVTSWNRGAERLFGYTADEMIGQSITRLFPPERFEEEAEILAKLRAGERIDHYETVRVTKDGRRIDVSLSVSPLKDDAGTIVGAAKVVRDITARKAHERRLAEAERALADNESRYRTLVEAASVVVWTCPPSGVQVEPQPTWMAYTGQSAEAMLGWGWLNAVHPDDRAYMADRWAAFVGNPQTFEAEFRLRRFDGTYRWTRVRAVPRLDERGGVVEWVGMNADITERKIVEARLELALSAGRAGVFEWNIRTGDAIVSGVLIDLLGADPQTGRVTFETWRRAVHADDGAHVAALVEEAGRTRQPRLSYDFRIGHPEGERWFTAQAQLTYDEAGALTHVVGINVDITDRKLAEAALQEANRRKDEFLATLAHELRNPLAPLRTGLHLLRTARDPAVMARARESMERQLAHMVRLVDDLLDVARIATGKLKLQRERLDLRAVLRQALETAAPAIEAGGQHVDAPHTGAEIAIVGDPVRLAQVFGNLLTNAAKYSDRGSTITLAIRTPSADRVEVEVTDTGIGIPPDAIGHVFDLFAQIEHGRTRSQGGLGLGLSLARRLVELHGGTIDVRSAGVGQGATFSVRLPVTPDAREIEANVPPADVVPDARCRVVVVDDNRDAADTLALALESAGHRVAVAYDGAEALDRIRTEQPDAAVIDIGLPEIDGYEVVRRLRAEASWASRVVWIAVTGWGQDTDKARAKGAGFDHHFTKPVDPHVLEAVLRDIAACRP